MTFLVKLQHDNGTTDEQVHAYSSRQAIRRFVSGIGSLGMINYIERCDLNDDGSTAYEVMGTSGMVLNLSVKRVS